MTPVIEISGLRKEYRRLRGRSALAVDGLDLTVPTGGVFGFLGPNGSGKTTTIRCLLGLVRPTSGTVRILGADPQVELAKVVHRIGSLVETPALFPGMSARRNLELFAGVLGLGGDRVDGVLDRVGLRDRQRDAVKGYSLGMRQRLAIAAALLRDPELLILDEPANGLDPAGIKEIRELLRSLGGEGRTVFVSSHLLGEVQLLCDRVAIVARGKLVTAGPVEEVLAAGRAGRAGVTVGVADPTTAAGVLAAAGLDSRPIGSSHLEVSIAPAHGAKVTEVLANAGMYLHELRPTAVDLETVFLELTSSPEGQP